MQQAIQAILAEFVPFFLTKSNQILELNDIFVNPYVDLVILAGKVMTRLMVIFADRQCGMQILKRMKIVYF